MIEIIIGGALIALKAYLDLKKEFKKSLEEDTKRLAEKNKRNIISWLKYSPEGQRKVKREFKKRYGDRKEEVLPSEEDVRGISEDTFIEELANEMVYGRYSIPIFKEEMNEARGKPSSAVIDAEDEGEE